jgi:hypothetical protein
MKTRTSFKRWAARSACAYAAAFALPVLAADFSADLPVEQKQGAVAYRSGGVGEDEAKAMQEAARRYPLALEFVARTGEERGGWLADVDVAIHDRRGNAVMESKASGPFLLVRLPPGSYVVTANYEGMQRSQRVAVAERGTRRVVFGW